MTENKEAIVEFLRTRGGRPAQAVEILSALRMGKKAAASLRRELRVLVRSGVVERSRGRGFTLPVTSDHTGRLSLARDGYGFVALEDEEGPDVFVPARDLQGGFQGDRVRVRMVC